MDPIHHGKQNSLVQGVYNKRNRRSLQQYCIPPGRHGSGVMWERFRSYCCREVPQRSGGRSSKSSAMVWSATFNMCFLIELPSRRHKCELAALQVLLQLVKEHNPGNVYSMTCTSVISGASLTLCIAQSGSLEDKYPSHCGKELVYKPWNHPVGPYHKVNIEYENTEYPGALQKT